jgi:hypothetical protein
MPSDTPSPWVVFVHRGIANRDSRTKEKEQEKGEIDINKGKKR